MLLLSRLTRIRNDDFRGFLASECTQKKLIDDVWYLFRSMAGNEPAWNGVVFHVWV